MEAERLHIRPDSSATLASPTLKFRYGDPNGDDWISSSDYLTQHKAVAESWHVSDSRALKIDMAILKFGFVDFVLSHP